MYIFLILTFVISLLIGIITIPNIVIISKKKRLFDIPNQRKVHTDVVSRLGGISFLPAVFCSLCLTLGIRYILNYEVEATYEANFFIELLFFIAGLVSIFFVGLADDLVGVGYRVKFLTQAIAASFLMLANIRINNLCGLFGIYELNPVVSVIFTIMAITLVVNSLNLIDGVDGLCSGLSIIALTSLSVWYLYYGLYIYTMVGLSILGAALAFFYYNVFGKRLKVFMGDAGSLMLGYIISFLAIKFLDFTVVYKSLNIETGFVIMLSLVFIPVFDAIRVSIERVINKKSPFLPDKTHIHHYILKMGFTHRQGTTILMCVTIILLIINILCYKININLLFMIDITYGVLFLIVIPRYVISQQKKKIN